MSKVLHMVKMNVSVAILVSIVAGCGVLQSSTEQVTSTPVASLTATNTFLPSSTLTFTPLSTFTPTFTPTLNPYTGPVKIYGQVTDERGNPIETNVAFDAFGLWDQGFVTTDSSGYYEKQVPDALQYIVSVNPMLTKQIGKYSFATGVLSQRKLVIRNGPEAQVDFTIGDGGTLWLQAYNQYGTEMAAQDFVDSSKVGAYPVGTFPYGEAIQAKYSGWPLYMGSIQNSNKNVGCILLPTGEPAEIWVVWRLPEVGTTFLEADNDGKGFTVEKGDVLPINLVYEFARTEYKKVLQQHQELQAAAYPLSSVIQNWLDTAQQNWLQAESYQQQGAGNTSAVYSYKVLTNVIKAREQMVLERAQQDIEKYRKGSVTFNIFDDKGNKLTNAKVEYQQVSHDFILSVGWPLPQQYTALRDAGIENSFFEAWWGEVETSDGVYNFPDSVLEQQEKAWLGYIMETGLWLSPAYPPAIPGFVAAMNPAELSSQAFEYSFDYVTHYANRIRLYAAYLEPELPQAYKYTLDEFVDIVRSSNNGVKTADPSMPTHVMIAHPIFKSILMDGVNYTISYDQFGNVLPGKTAYPSPARSGYDFLVALNQAGVNYDAIGLEYAYGAPYPSIDLGIFGTTLDFYSTLLKKVFVSEIFYPTMEEYPNLNKWWEGYGGWHAGYTDKTQADWAASTLTMAFGNPNVIGYEWIPTSDGPDNYYINGGGLFRKDGMTPRPSLVAIGKLINSWTTTGIGTTDATGSLKLRGFGGNYEFTITTEDGQTYHAQAHITEQQENTINLIVDTTLPVIKSVSVDPTIVKNGDQMEITTDAGENGLVVTADVSQLDSTKVEPIVLSQTADGLYRGSFNLSPANLVANGPKSITITATDSSRNVSSKVTQGVLNNPAPVLDQNPPDDGFDGVVLDRDKWSPGINGGGTVEQNNRLIARTDGSTTHSNVLINANWSLIGDFDIQVEFQIGEGWSSPNSDHIDGATFGVNIDGKSYHITRLRRVEGSGSDVLFAWSTSGAVSGEIPSNALSGKYRLVRNGTILYLLYDFGAGWKEFKSVAVPSSAATVYMGNGCINTSKTFTTYFDNFHINSGLTTFKP